MATYGYNKYGDNLARKKRRHFFLKIFLFSGIVLIAAGLLVYAAFFSTVMKITEVNVNGLKTIEAVEIFSIVDSLKNDVLFGALDLRPQMNILFFDDQYLKEKISGEYLVVEKVEIVKEFPHKLTINITERTPIGTWCLADRCFYFDNSGTLWGKALRSSGSLLLTIDDLRTTGDTLRSIDKEILEPIKIVVDRLNSNDIKIRKVEISNELPGDFNVHTADGYYLIFNASSDIDKQIKILKILLDERGDSFKPTYIDLRIDERIYYK